MDNYFWKFSCSGQTVASKSRNRMNFPADSSLDYAVASAFLFSTGLEKKSNGQDLECRWAAVRAVKSFRFLKTASRSI